MAAAEVKGMKEPSYDKMAAWLMEHGLLNLEESLSEEQVVWHYNMLSKCTFSEAVREESRYKILCHLLPCEARLAAK